MNLKESINKFISYNHWANTRLTDWLRSLSPELLYSQVNSSFGTIDLTLQHMKNAQNFWHSVITETGIKSPDKTISINSIDDVIEDLLSSSQRMVDTYTKFSDQQLGSTVKSTVMTKSRYDFILHVINHNSYHRGQIVTIARLLGVSTNIPETDYEAFLWIEQPGSET